MEAEKLRLPEILKSDDQLLELMTTWLLNSPSLATRQTYLSAVNDFTKFAAERDFKIKTPKDIRPLHLISWRDEMLKAELAPNTICLRISAVSSLCESLLHSQELEINPVKSIKRPPAENRKAPSYFKDREIQKMLDLFSDHSKTFQLQNAAVIATLAFTGQRVSSILNLKKSHLLHMGDILTIALTTKGLKRRTLPVPAVAADLLKKLASLRSDDEYLFQGTRGKKTTGKPINRRTVHALIKTSLRRAKCETSKSSHSFRRSLVSKMVNDEKIPVDKVRELITFHSSIATTLRYKKEYSESVDKHPLIEVFNKGEAKSEEFETPSDLFQRLDEIFGFTLDVSASALNSKVPNNFFSKETDGLKQPWQTRGSVWCNPPYTKNAEFIDKAIAEAATGQGIVCLIPSRTDTGYFHRAVECDHLTHRLDIKGRLTFGGSRSEYGASFASMLLIFNGQNLSAEISTLKDLGFVSKMN